MDDVEIISLYYFYNVDQVEKILLNASILRIVWKKLLSNDLVLLIMWNRFPFIFLLIY